MIRIEFDSKTGKGAVELKGGRGNIGPECLTLFSKLFDEIYETDRVTGLAIKAVIKDEFDSVFETDECDEDDMLESISDRLNAVSESLSTLQDLVDKMTEKAEAE